MCLFIVTGRDLLVGIPQVGHYSDPVSTVWTAEGARKRREVVVMTSSVSTATNTAPPLQGCTTPSLPTTYIQQRIKTRGHDGGHGDWAQCWQN